MSDASRIFPFVILIELAGHVIVSPALIRLQNCLGINPSLNLWKSVSFIHEFSEDYGLQSAMKNRALVTPVPLYCTVTRGFQGGSKEVSRGFRWVKGGH